MILRDDGWPLCGFDAVVHSAVPLRSGLSSSAALEAAAAVLLAKLGGFTIESVRLAKLCQRAENEIVGMQCGILDQFSSILGRAGTALVLDCRQLTHRNAPVPHDVHAVICNTCAPRALTGSEYGERRAQCEEGARRYCPDEQTRSGEAGVGRQAAAVCPLALRIHDGTPRPAGSAAGDGGH